MSNTTLTRLSGILTENFGVDGATLAAETTFEELEFDSLVMVEFALYLQKEFGIQVDDHELLDCVTVADAVVLVQGKGVAA